MKKIRKKISFPNLLDITAFFLWGLLMLKYWVTGELYKLIHPNYFLLVFASGIILLIIASLKIVRNLIKKAPSTLKNEDNSSSLLPKKGASFLLIMVAMIGLTTEPKILNSTSALQRGLTDSLPPVSLQPEAFANASKPEDRTLIEWMRTINVYPEPDSYTGQKANLTGFVVHLDSLPDNYIYLSRFVLTCCAADAYPVGIPVKLPESNSKYPADTWLEIEGTMMTETLAYLGGKSSNNNGEVRYLVVNAQNVKIIPTPRNPYAQ
ncbi:MAG: TIGR03943 family protein [Cyanobacterium sp. T60_A2020_053]|nr:TIGR03943 family protein [Cyanobacterium sp. T60_A2020_053]